MFEQMISVLKKGSMPENNLLRRRFEAALIKKMGVIKTPYSFWPADPKINPPAKQLLWAAILLQDLDNFGVMEAVISTELEEKQRAKGHPESMQTHASKVQQIIQAYIYEFIELAPDETFKENLRLMAAELYPALQT